MTDIVNIDQIYIGVSDLTRSEAFYDRAMRVLGYRKTRFALNREPRIEYFGGDAGYVLQQGPNAPVADAAARKAVTQAVTQAATPSRPLCLRVASLAEVGSVASRLREAGIAASELVLRPGNVTGYWSTFFTDPDGLRLEVSNCRRLVANRSRA